MSSITDSDNDLLSEDEVLDSLINLKPYTKTKKTIKQEIIVISSDDDEFPSVDTLLSNISKKRKITSISEDAEESLASNDYIFSHENKEYRIKKYEIQENLNRFKTRFKTKKFSNMINDLVKNYKENIFFKEFQKIERAKRKNLKYVYERFYHFIPGYYGNQGYEMIYEHILKYYIDSINHDRDKHDLINEVFIPEIGVFLIMDDFKVDHDLANEIRIHSVNYGFENFIGDKDKNFSNIEFDLFMENFKEQIPVIID